MQRTGYERHGSAWGQRAQAWCGLGWPATTASTIPLATLLCHLSLLAAAVPRLYTVGCRGPAVSWPPAVVAGSPLPVRNRRGCWWLGVCAWRGLNKITVVVCMSMSDDDRETCWSRSLRLYLVSTEGTSTVHLLSELLASEWLQPQPKLIEKSKGIRIFLARIGNRLYL